MHRFSYRWNLADGYPTPDITKHGKTVFTTFACGGGSSMGYKLAGYDVVGANDIDPKMAMIYKKNHKPKHFFECPISDLLTMELPQELYNLDVLDGSPPCSTFSMAGTREKTWKKNKKFREGQQEQVLSDLFFDWIKLVERLQPKVAIAENVKGMLAGNAKLYTKRVVRALEAIGYSVQLFLLNSASMGVPQRRERVFFICSKINKSIELQFNERPVPFGSIDEGVAGIRLPITGEYQKRIFRESTSHHGHTKSKKSNSIVGFYYRCSSLAVLPTIKATQRHFYKDGCVWLSDNEVKLGSSFPLDYDKCGLDINYVAGMSVPPVMMANVAYEVYNQLLKD